MALDHDGDTFEVQGSGSKPYVLKRHSTDVFSCSCPAWRNCGGVVNQKTCKHLKKVRGEAVEAARVGAALPAVAPLPLPATDDDTPDSERDRILARAAAQGRKLRPDEKAKLNGPRILLANKFSDYGGLDPTGWWYSEKLDGVRAYWTGKQFISREGNVYPAPDWFTKNFPDHPLDGEIWLGRGMFQKTLFVRSTDAGEKWKKATYMVFDHPTHGGVFEDRMAALDELHKANRPPYMKIHGHVQVPSLEWLKNELSRVVGLKGEGLMIRMPKSLYEVGRSGTLLKVKPFQDAEAVVIGYNPGTGRLKGMVGSLEVRMPNGKTFAVGSGLEDKERKNPPKLGAIITYRWTELTDDGVPKCGSFVAERNYE